MAINALPYEIIDKILNYVMYDNDDFADPIRTLASISRTSRRLHQIAEPALYSTFEEFNTRSLIQYLSTIINNPHLAAHTKTYYGAHKPWTFSKYSANVAFSALKSKHPRLLEIIRENTRRLARAEILFEKLEEGSWDTTTSLTLVHLPNLQHLHLMIIGFKKWNGFPARADHEVDNYLDLGGTLLSACHRHKQLSTLTIHPSRESCRELDLAHLLALLQDLVTLKKLSLRGWDLEFSGFNAKLSIVELELLDSTINASSFDSLFRLFPALEKLRYQHSRARDYTQRRPLTTSLVHALIQTKPPLKELYINSTSEDRLLVEGTLDMVKSFSGFESLEVIDVLAFDQWMGVHFNTLKGSIRPLAELLPSKIKRLVLRRASTWTIKQTIVLLEQKYQFPSLQALKMEFAVLVEDRVLLNEIEGELSLLREACVRHGIDFSGRIYLCPDESEMIYGPNSDSIG